MCMYVELTLKNDIVNIEQLLPSHLVVKNGRFNGRNKKSLCHTELSIPVKIDIFKIDALN